MRLYTCDPTFTKFTRLPDNREGAIIWGRFMATADRHVALTELDGGSVSTVFLGIDHGFDFSGKSKPVLFETMIFSGDHLPSNQVQIRATDVETARYNHFAAVAQLQEEIAADFEALVKRMDFSEVLDPQIKSLLETIKTLPPIT